MKKKLIANITSYTLAGFVVLGGFVYKNHLKAEYYKLQLVNTYQHAFTELVSGVDDLDNALQKCQYSTSSAMISATCAEVYGKAMSAQYAMSELPFSSFEFQDTAGFIAKVGDYAFMLGKKAGRGEQLSDDELSNLKKLSETSTILAGNLNQLASNLNDGFVSIAEMDEFSDTAAKMGEEVTSNVLKDNFTVMEGEFPDIPTLIYDGPFSSHISGMLPKLLEGKTEITSDEALANAAKFMGMNKDLLKYTGERGGSLPVYMFTANADGGTISFEVTKQGGIVTDVFSSRVVDISALSAKDAVKIASKFLKSKGFESMKESYSVTDGNILTVNFAYVQDNIICYPDLVKISVALDTGKICGFESQGYVMNHHTREIPKDEVPEEEARKSVSKQLVVLTHDMTFIPTSGKNEVYCHEFKCENGDGEKYIVYVNAATGAEEKILIVMETENGTLTI
jgi:spore germination protein